jgi:hypothetical protein
VSVVDAVEQYLDGLGALSDSPLAATALVLAEELDDPDNSATSKSMCARALTETLDKLRALEPDEKPKVSKLDELRQRRDQRSAGA